MKWKAVTNEARLLLIGIPVLLWTLIPVYHLFLFAISERDSATSGRLWPKNPTLQNFRDRVRAEALLPEPLLAAARQLADDRGGGRR